MNLINWIDLKRVISALVSWSSKWDMWFNVKKCKIVWSSHTYNTCQYMYSLGKKLKGDLGCEISNNATQSRWQWHHERLQNQRFYIHYCELEQPSFSFGNVKGCECWMLQIGAYLTKNIWPLHRYIDCCSILLTIRI